MRLETSDDDTAAHLPFERSDSPGLRQRQKGAAYTKVGEEGVSTMYRFTLYETNTRFYMVGNDISDRHYRLLQIDRTAPPGNLSIFEDDIVYDKRGINRLLNDIDDSQKGLGGLRLKHAVFGILGFIRFTEAYYMLLITKRKHVAVVGGHYIYLIEGTELVPLTTGSSSRFYRDRNPEEARYLSILSNIDLARSFYFALSYNITRTLQHNIIREREALRSGLHHAEHDYNDMFIWNHHLLQPAKDTLRKPYDWCQPIIHGFVDQAALDVFGRRVYITVIARRSRFFAGARFLKRGTNDLGYVANDVETEQIASELLTTSFHAPGPRLFASPTYTSYVQHRGSIPLYWTQDNTGVTPKPDIDLNLNDPFYSASALHFDDLFKRYGAPVYCLNLIKARERNPRESKLLYEYQNALTYLNQSLPADKKILYRAFDMSRASKTRGQDVIGTLEAIAEGILQRTGFFHNGDAEVDTPTVQNGVARTNCIDCLDRTNAAQFVIGKRALGRQLHALGVIAGNTVEYDSDVVNLFTNMFHDHGDTIAIQYGGSHLVNTMATYRKLNHWQSHSRDMVESFKRYYHNSFLDSQRQEAYNLFLGNYIYTQGQPMLWDLQTDYYLHHADPRAWAPFGRRSYIEWFHPEYLQPRVLPPTKYLNDDPDEEMTEYDDYWSEYYRTTALSSFAKIYAFRTNTTSKYIIDKHSGKSYNHSPFIVRHQLHDPDSPGKKQRKGVTIMDPHSEEGNVYFPNASHPSIKGPPVSADSPVKQSILRGPSGLSQKNNGAKTSNSTAFVPADKSLMTQWTLNQFHDNSLNPSVTGAEADEYDRYISHPQNLPLVISTAIPDDGSHTAFVDYLKSANTIFDVGKNETDGIHEEDVADYAEFLEVVDDPLTVTEEDGGKKRYKAYKQWLRGKSLFKQSKVDPEYKA
ncbi:Polyphosphoinositide phosphatase, factor-induced gene 4 protein [Aulographum hederae CBS 113979]|uniref:Polyphosphoinositide phosphatase, factor-induced gene 4 protein n=1 Tax=Aulographum hederae CBS 113979 TaxID=1176131 RepID=A0A6G1HCR2_9PEZI|nr:Polyphosphoinositide phosphatase, factor-induced gene 4 protein [Aulographum hederae CBS 113979]